MIAAGVCLVTAHADDKLKPEELVTKHLESLAAEARARVNGTQIKGNASIAVRLCGEVRLTGTF